jgi:acetyl-CoA synthetase
VLPQSQSYEDLCARFRWSVPQFYNIAADICDKWADGRGRLALVHQRRDGGVERFTFDDIQRLSNRAANLFAAHGLRAGDRVGILLAQEPQSAIAHLATYKIGAIAVPLFVLFGTDALQYRLADCGAKLLVTDSAGAEKIERIRHALPELQTLFCIEGQPPGCEDFTRSLARASDRFTTLKTQADDPALIIYTSGTTGNPKGALHAHRTLLGHLPGVEMSHNFLGRDGDSMWTPADWAWIGGLIDVLFPAWHHGLAVVAHRFEKFDPEAAADLMTRHRVRNVFLPPTALKMLRGLPVARLRGKLALRSVASGGESLGAELLEWGREVFGLTINEFYGQTECNMTVSACEALFPARPGAIGKAVVGHDVGILDDAGKIVAPGVQGHIAVRRPDPVMFLGYWNNPEATRGKFIGDWLITGDIGAADEDGYVRFVGRNDDVITSAGYRIGPGPIEDCLLKHPAVRMAAVVGVPDPLRTEIVKAFVVLNDGYVAGEELTRQLQDHVRHRLSAHEYPRRIAYLDALPLTATGKIVRRELRKLG